MEVIKTFEKVSSHKLNYKIGGRRKGDIIQAYADTKKANRILDWCAKFSLEDALLSAWKWEKKLQEL